MGNLGHYLDPGEMDRKVTIQTASGVQDAYGEEINTWLDTLDVWAKMEWETGSEGMDADQVVSHDKVKFTIRYTTVDAKNRIKYEGKYYDIETIQEVGGRKRFLILITKIYDSNGGV